MKHLNSLEKLKWCAGTLFTFVFLFAMYSCHKETAQTQNNDTFYNYTGENKLVKNTINQLKQSDVQTHFSAQIKAIGKPDWDKSTVGYGLAKGKTQVLSVPVIDNNGVLNSYFAVKIINDSVKANPVVYNYNNDFLNNKNADSKLLAGRNIAAFRNNGAKTPETFQTLFAQSEKEFNDLYLSKAPIADAVKKQQSTSNKNIKVLDEADECKIEISLDYFLKPEYPIADVGEYSSYFDQYMADQLLADLASAHPGYQYKVSLNYDLVISGSAKAIAQLSEFQVTSLPGMSHGFFLTPDESRNTINYDLVYSMFYPTSCTAPTGGGGGGTGTNAPGLSQTAIENDINNGLLTNAVTGDGIELYLLANYKCSGLLNLSVFARASQTIRVGDYDLTPNFDANNVLVFYSAWRSSFNGIEYIIKADQLSVFQSRIAFYTGAANLVYLHGVPTQAQIQMMLGNYVDGLAKMWGQALTDPLYLTNLAMVMDIGAAPQNEVLFVDYEYSSTTSKSIPNFNVNMTLDEFETNLSKNTGASWEQVNSPKGVVKNLYKGDFKYTSRTAEASKSGFPSVDVFYKGVRQLKYRLTKTK